jgi:LacI family transcriptional regulator
MSSEPITIKDIAKMLNVSPSTVSRALKDNPEIGITTRMAVKKLAEEFNYQPNTVAQGLRRKKTFTIGVVVPEIVHYFFSSVISGIEEIAYSNNYQVILCQSNERFDQEVMNLNTLAKSHVDGILISISKESRDFTHVYSMQEKGIPVVYYDRSPSEGLPVDSVLVDDFGGAYRATEHLLKSGCRNLAHFFGPMHVNIYAARLAGFRKAHEDLGVSIDENLIVPADNFRLGFDAVIGLCKQKLIFDGIFAVNDLTAVGALKALKSQGISIPQEVSVIGFGDDTMLSEMVDPTLSSVVQPGFEMGRRAMQLLLDRIEGTNTNPAQLIRLDTTLNIRQSSRSKP